MIIKILNKGEWMVLELFISMKSYDLFGIILKYRNIYLFIK